MGALSKEQRDAFWREGLVVELTAEDPAALGRQCDGWVEESRSHAEDDGATPGAGASI